VSSLSSPQPQSEPSSNSLDALKAAKSLGSKGLPSPSKSNVSSFFLECFFFSSNSTPLPFKISALVTSLSPVKSGNDFSDIFLPSTSSFLISRKGGKFKAVPISLPKGVSRKDFVPILNFLSSLSLILPFIIALLNCSQSLAFFLFKKSVPPLILLMYSKPLTYG
jgi:hypothetical protein